MSPFKSILFPVDFSQRCYEAAAYVSAMAEHFDAQLTLLHVIDAPIGYYGLDPAMATTAAYYEIISQRRREELTSFSNAIVRGKLPGSKVKCVVTHGDPAAVIVEHARTNAVQLIMMPTHGYGPFRHLLLGSVTAKVLHDAECPVWTSTHQSTEQEPKVMDCRNVLCVVEVTTESVSLIRSAAEIAREFGAVLRLLYVIQAHKSLVQQSVHDIGRSRLLLECARVDLQRLPREAGTKADLCLEAGDISKIVRSKALDNAADLVVIGRSQTHGVFQHQHDHSSEIIRESPCPVLSICCRKDLPLAARSTTDFSTVKAELEQSS